MNRVWPCRGVRVLEVAQDVAGPYAGALFAALGAEVIKVEPQGGDRTRWLGPFPGDVVNPDRSGAFIALNAGKRGLVLNPTARGDRTRLRRLALGADVIIHDLQPESAAELGLDKRTLWADRPDLIVVAVTPFGQTGPYRHHGGAEIVYQALSGCMDITGDPTREPLQIGVPLAQVAAGQNAFIAAMAGLLAREKGGRLADISILESMCSLVEHSPFFWAYLGRIWKRRGNWAGVAGWGLYPCRDGYVGVVSGIADAWPRFVRMLGLEKPELLLQSARTVHAGELNAAIFQWLSDKSCREAYRLAQEQYRLPFGYLCGAADVLASAQLRFRRFWRRLRQPGLDPLLVPGPPFRVNGWRWRVQPAPRLEADRRVRDWRGRGASWPLVGTRSDGLPLEGIRVLDLGQVWAGPHCGKVLADLGAQVIKVESPVRPDILRGPLHPRSPAEGCYPDNNPGERPFDRHAYFIDRNLGKMGIAVDLGREEGRQVLLDLARVSDVLIENFSPGVMARMGLGYPELNAVNRGIIYLSMPANGNYGPESSYSGFGITNDLMSGMAKATGYPGEPQNLGINASDPLAGLHGAAAVLVALWVRARTGRGAFIDLSQRESAIRACFQYVLDYQMNGRDAEPLGNRHPRAAPHGCYPCRGDDRWICIAATDDAAWHGLCRAMGRPDLAEDPRFRIAAERKFNEDALDAIITSWTAEQDAQELMHLLQSAGVPAGAVADARDLMTDAHLEARDFFHDVEQPTAGKRRHLGGGIVLDPPGRMPRRRPAPTFGADNEFILHRVLGYPPERIRRLRQTGVIASAPTGYEPPQQGRGEAPSRPEN